MEARKSWRQGRGTDRPGEQAYRPEMGHAHAYVRTALAASCARCMVARKCAAVLPALRVRMHACVDSVRAVSVEAGPLKGAAKGLKRQKQRAGCVHGDHHPSSSANIMQALFCMKL